MGGIWKNSGWEQSPDDAGAGDAQLVDELRRGTPAAFAGLHEQYATGIYNLALRVVRHAPDAEDITQDVLIRAFERLPRDRDVMLRPWLYRITLNRCYDYLRTASRRPVLADPVCDAPAPGDPFEQSELQRLLEEALDDLTRRQRLAMLLKDVHGLSLAEVAASLEVTPGSVEVLLARARRAFRAAFKDRCAAAGRPVPRSAGGFLTLPWLPLPPALAASLPLGGAPLPAAPGSLPPAAVVSPPVTITAGSGIGAALGLPAALKAAVAVAAAAASMGTAGIAAPPVEEPPHPAAAATVAVTQGGVARTERAARTAVVSSPAGGSPSSVSPPAGPAVAAAVQPSPEASSDSPGDAASRADPLSAASPSPSPEPLAAPVPSPTPTASAPASASPSASPAPSPSISPVPTPSPSVSGEPVAAPEPADPPEPGGTASPEGY